ncbi:TPA: hypothetical protein ACPJ0L_003667 [Vibrio alginolyticus]|uniref:hypothetical protein n=1 Tax=Vibrio TaxID=662 RepID=UPI00215E6750|nr:MULTISPECIES: hypothetical protein [Vibrio]MCS0136026.1 hypothetical protein [Vibrio alginolyticus]MCS0286645.1 hypothetical protein [Vibrio alginolyticus]MDW1549195.1 hypothetical protein [Vibrio sp. YT-18]HCZ9048662.1 hypothetical protein [Vibrio alginolyticus]
MQYLGVVLFVLCIAHYVYQAIILPSFRQSARDKLFILRDTLRDKLIEVQDVADKKTLRAFKEVDDGINRSLNRLHLLTFTNFIRASMNSDGLRRHDASFKKFHALLESSQDETPKEIYIEVGKVLHTVLSVNSLMFIVYLLPFVIIMQLIGSLYQRVKQTTDYMADATLVVRARHKLESSSDRLYA